MKKIFFLLLMGVFFLTVPGMTDTFRCGTHLISVGDHSFEVLRNCGEPIMKEVVGYTLTQNRRRELKMEHWIYGPKGGYYYLLVFEGSVLTKITSFRKE